MEKLLKMILLNQALIMHTLAAINVQTAHPGTFGDAADTAEMLRAHAYNVEKVAKGTGERI